MPKQAFNYSLFLFLYYAHAGAFASYVSLFFADKGMTAPQVGVLMSTIPVMRMIGPNLWGALADRTGKRVLVLRSTALAASIAFCAFFVGHGFVQFLLAMLVLNLFASAQSPLSEALMLAEMRGDLSNYGRLRLWGSLGFVVAVMGTATVLERWGAQALPPVAGMLLLGVLWASLRIRESSALPATQAAPKLASVLRQGAVIAFFVSTALMVAAHMALYVYYSLYLETRGYGKTVIGAMWSLGVLAEIVFFYFQASVLRRFGARRLMLFACAVGVLRFAMIGAGAQWLALLVLAQLLHAATFAAHHCACVLTMQRWFAGALQARGQALYMSLAYGIGGTLGGLFMSLCWKQLGPPAVYFAAALLAAGAGLAAAQSFRLIESERAELTYP
jgi:MFS transporter, PPP family, 3-phenylpropionic acid transporter